MPTEAGHDGRRARGVVPGLPKHITDSLVRPALGLRRNICLAAGAAALTGQMPQGMAVKAVASGAVCFAPRPGPAPAWTPSALPSPRLRVVRKALAALLASMSRNFALPPLMLRVREGCRLRQVPQTGTPCELSIHSGTHGVKPLGYEKHSRKLRLLSVTTKPQL